MVGGSGSECAGLGPQIGETQQHSLGKAAGAGSVSARGDVDIGAFKVVGRWQADVCDNCSTVSEQAPAGS